MRSNAGTVNGQGDVDLRFPQFSPTITLALLDPKSVLNILFNMHRFVGRSAVVVLSGVSRQIGTGFCVVNREQVIDFGD